MHTDDFCEPGKAVRTDQHECLGLGHKLINEEEIRQGQETREKTKERGEDREGERERWIQEFGCSSSCACELSGRF